MYPFDIFCFKSSKFVFQFLIILSIVTISYIYTIYKKRVTKIKQTRNI